MCASKNATAGISNPRDRISWWTMNWRKKKSWFILKQVLCQLHLQNCHPRQNNAKGVKCKKEGFCYGQFLTMSGHRLSFTMYQPGLPPTSFCASRYHPCSFLSFFNAWRGMTCSGLPAGVLYRCDRKLGSSAFVHTILHLDISPPTYFIDTY